MALFDFLFGSDDASDAAKDASKIQADAQREALDYLKQREAIPQGYREEALAKLGSVYGLTGSGIGGQQPLQGLQDQNQGFTSSLQQISGPMQQKMKELSRLQAQRDSAKQRDDGMYSPGFDVNPMELDKKIQQLTSEIISMQGQPGGMMPGETPGQVPGMSPLDPFNTGGDKWSAISY